MTQEQFEKLQPYLKENGINVNGVDIDRGLMCELENKIREANGAEHPLLMIEKGHLRYDPHYEEELISNIYALMVMSRNDESMHSLETVFKSLAGYLIASDTTRAEFEDELAHFVQYCETVRKSLGLNDAPQRLSKVEFKKSKYTC